ncbi:MAG TPA: hypothetical protein VLY03_08500 [Bacteroidota bacterium]|nr:hypothetical protein [Bacteroidota bacterium]
MAVGATIALMIIAMLLGKNFPRIRPLSYIVIVLIALLQVGIVLYSMYTMQPPTE